MPTSPVSTQPRLCSCTKKLRAEPRRDSMIPCLPPVGLMATILPSINSHGPMSPIASSSSPVIKVVSVCAVLICTVAPPGSSPATRRRLAASPVGTYSPSLLPLPFLFPERLQHFLGGDRQRGNAHPNGIVDSIGDGGGHG